MIVHLYFHPICYHDSIISFSRNLGNETAAPVISRSRKRAPNFSVIDRFLIGL